jgi:alpha-mannosidase
MNIKKFLKAFVFFLFIVFLFQLNYSQEKKPQFNPQDYTGYIVGHAHIDLSWLWRWEETVHDIATHTFQGTLERMKKMPGLTFAQSQASVYEAIEKNYPELFQEIKSRIKEGTWIPVGGMWCEPDLNMPDGESLVRQLLYGKRYFMDKFGVDVKVGWNPDSFGHNWQLPQILSKSGIKYYVFERCGPEDILAFWWEGADGSRVLAYIPPGWYVVSMRDGIKDVILDAAKKSDLKGFMLLYGEGDHGGGPRDSDLEAITKFRNDKSQPKMEFASPEKYFQMLEQSKQSFPVLKKELNFTFPACYTTQARTKKNNRKSENLLLTAEKFSALAVASGFRDYYPERDLDEAWKIVLRNQFHDILDGSSIGVVYDETEGFYKEAFERGRRAFDFSLETITSNIDTRGEGKPFVVYNPLLWERTDAVLSEIPLAKNSSTIKILDADGNEVPLQIIRKFEKDNRDFCRFVFVALNVPSLGYKVYRIINSEISGAFKTSLRVSEGEIENEFFRVSLNPVTGWIKSLLDKPNNREVLSGEGNILQAIVDEPESMSAWELGLKDKFWNIGEGGATIEILENGPVRGIIRVKNIFRNSFFQQDIVLYHNIPRIDCHLQLNWQERSLMIKASFPVNVKNEEAYFEIPFGSISRKADGTEVPALKWIDVSDSSGNYGVSLLNDCKYGFDVKGSTMRLSVIHGATYPDPEADRGGHDLLYSLYPHKGTWKEANSIRRGYELNNPLMARVAMIHAGKLPPAYSFVRVEPENVIASSLKKEMGYDSRGLVMRLYEAYGKKTEMKITFPWPIEAVETDLMERPIRKLEASGDSLRLNIEPFEIKTIKILKK